MLTKLAGAPTDRPIVVLYVRLSSEEQAAGQGQERQVEGLMGWCAKERLVADVMLQDIGFSAFVGAHILKGELGRLIAAIDAGRVAPGSTLVMENLDRLSRQDPFAALAVFSGILTKDVAIVTVTDGVRYSRDGTGMQRMMTIIIGAMTFGRSNSESEVKSDRVGKAWKAKIAKAREVHAPHGNRCPAWIRLTKDGYELIEERAAEVRWMFEQTIKGRGRRQIVKDLIARKVEPWTPVSAKRPEPVWSDSYIQKILTGGEAFGEYRPSLSPKGQRKISLEPITGYYPAAVDRLTAERARAASGLRAGSGGRKGSFKNLFQGLCVCGACGAGMTIENKGARSSGPKLICQRATLADCEHRHRYDYAAVQAAVIFVIEQRADELLQSSRSRFDDLADIVAKRRIALADVTARAARLATQMQRIDDDDGMLTQAFRELRDEQRTITAEIEGLDREASGTREIAHEQSLPALLAFYRRLDAIPPDERPAARNAINQSLRAILKALTFKNGLVTVDMLTGEQGFAEIPGRVAPRNNPGQFGRGLDASGKQARTGMLSSRKIEN